MIPRRSFALEGFRSSSRMEASAANSDVYKGSFGNVGGVGVSSVSGGANNSLGDLGDLGLTGICTGYFGYRCF
ncbi:hypothetical protein MLD38_008956 [Melastoma candidum]|uniref:Uncharacterized protein n=1 Tax=Melastoma candidum TaxID=119954 RepID=A0ACB9RZ32_9MYRT|nr:hypothetical protein MLD38_008956 [Melastoma candidum]